MTLDVEKYVKSVEDQYDFPRELQFHSYHEPARGSDVYQVYFRYSPYKTDFSADKFGFEVACDNGNVQQKNALIDMKKREVHDALESMEATWKQKFNFIFWRGVPYTMDEGDVFTVKCEVCDEAAFVDLDFDNPLKKDVCMMYLLKRIDHDCDDDWEPAAADEKMIIEEGAHFPRPSVDRKI